MKYIHVKIDWSTSLIVPAEDGTELLRILTKAEFVDEEYAVGGYSYRIKNGKPIEFTIIDSQAVTTEPKESSSNENTESLDL